MIYLIKNVEIKDIYLEIFRNIFHWNNKNVFVFIRRLNLISLVFLLFKTCSV